jgi:UDP-2,3-diacylglucosamine pyrophosphatase LpxH
MNFVQHRMPENFKVYDMSDFHIGSPNCAEETLCETVDKIASEKDSYLIFKGDAIECISPKDRRFNWDCIDFKYKTPIEQIDRAIEIFKPVAHKILVWMEGNHEQKTKDIINLGLYFAQKLEVPFGAYHCQVQFNDAANRLMFKTYHHHGFGNISSNAKDAIQYRANRRAGIKHKLAKLKFDDVIYMSMGHNHQLEIVEPTIQDELSLYIEDGKIHQTYKQSAAQDSRYISPDARWYATTGSFRKSFTALNSNRVDYAEMCGYAPSEIGYALMTVEDRKLTKVEKVVA